MRFELKDSGEVDRLTLKMRSAPRGSRSKHKDGIGLKCQAPEFPAGATGDALRFEAEDTQRNAHTPKQDVLNQQYDVPSQPYLGFKGIFLSHAILI